MNCLQGNSDMTETLNAEILTEVHGRLGCITLNRPKALNALSLGMVQILKRTLKQWQADPDIVAVVVRGQGKEGPFGAFCAGGDIRFFHQAAWAGDKALEDFFTEEYALNYLIHTYSKPYIAFMDGIVMGGGMGISQGASTRVVTERTKMAMPETHIGLFPDVGGGYFLSRCPGALGEFLGLTGHVMGAAQAMAAHLADGYIESGRLANIWQTLISTPFENGQAVEHWVRSQFGRLDVPAFPARSQIDTVFKHASVLDIVQHLEASADDWSQETAKVLRHRSPLMLQVVLEQIRKARGMSLADDLRMERDMVHHCFNMRSTDKSETVEGIRAFAVDKDHSPRWQPARIEDVSSAEVAAFFVSPWTAAAHPLATLG
jgi:enoyl-CoA hydratase/carnithine racemase